MSNEYKDFVLKKFKQEEESAMLNHAALGIAGEAGELVDAIKKHTIYGRELDKENLIEELGDLFFYMNVIMEMKKFTLDEVIEHNISKLDKRYEKGFTKEEAKERKDKK